MRSAELAVDTCERSNWPQRGRTACYAARTSSPEASRSACRTHFRLSKARSGWLVGQSDARAAKSGPLSSSMSMSMSSRVVAATAKSIISRGLQIIPTRPITSLPICALVRQTHNSFYGFSIVKLGFASNAHKKLAKLMRAVTNIMPIVWLNDEPAKWVQDPFRSAKQTHWLSALVDRS